MESEFWSSIGATDPEADREVRPAESAGPTGWIPLEGELGAEFQQAPAHNLDHVPPLVIRGLVPRLLIEDGVPVEDVIDVEIPLQPGPAYREEPTETEIQLCDPFPEDRAGGRELERDILVARRSGLAGTRREIPAQ